MYQIANVTFVQSGDLLDVSLLHRTPSDDPDWTNPSGEQTDDHPEGRAHKVRSDRFPRRRKPRPVLSS